MSNNIRDEPLLATVQTNDNSTISHPTTFDKIIKESNANAVVNKVPNSTKMNSVMSGSRQKSRKNKVILPKIMFYKQSPVIKPQDLPLSNENSDRLISLDRILVDPPQLAAQQNAAVNLSLDEALMSSCNNMDQETSDSMILSRHE